MLTVKKIVRNNIKLCFPEKKEYEIKKIEKKFYSHICDVLLETLKSIDNVKKINDETFPIKQNRNSKSI